MDVMKKAGVLFVGAALLLSGCGTYAGSGAYNGAALGSIFGSAIGGINGGWRGSDIGTVVGMAGGAVIGGVIGAQADKAEQQKYEEYKKERRAGRDSNNRAYDNEGAQYDESGFDPSNRGDDVLYDFNEIAVKPDVPEMKIGSQPTMNIGSAHEGYENGSLEIRNLRFVDPDNDNVMTGGETGKVVFEVYNNSSSAFYNITPVVAETTGNKRIYISGSICVEKIVPGRGIRYTAMVKADKRIKDGTANFEVYASDTGGIITKVESFSLPVRKRR